MKYTTTLASTEPIAITIGNFDGIHLGHQRLLQELQTVAQAHHCKPVLVTFTPHTLMVVRPDIDVQWLTTLEEKLQIALHIGTVEDTIVIHFTPEVAALTAEEFMDLLCQHFNIKALVVGSDFSLGHKRMGNVAFLQEYGQRHNIEVRAVTLQEAERERISSTRIRALIKEGQVAEANELLGHPVRVDGIVVHGDERGRLLGFPTANLRPEAHKLIPANGVYAVRVQVQQKAESDEQAMSPVYNGVVNIGIRPTFNGKERLIEAHLLDISRDLYDTYIVIEFIARLRGEQRFPGIDALKAQIAMDSQQARHILAIRSVSH
ncbi:bifunctional riboflavin kinase/FAD synthetase [Ktedonospora formicarum]|uniref:Riboflavin biosynthesis protein n=1 Tax=Ktedonospora formicarum TaxID=2778364 RepID=A0A8J3I394_9CHLR|nr:bifunctional riboflavin kinase/FAD synthetase [Ktedonospora formicarum]GHO45213.1 riboflavin biosynthesis protein [Ktedonospora formicarum]